MQPRPETKKARQDCIEGNNEFDACRFIPSRYVLCERSSNSVGNNRMEGL